MREMELENHIVKLNHDIRNKESVIESKSATLFQESQLNRELRQAISQIERNISLNQAKLPEIRALVLDQVKIPAETSK